MYVYTNQPREVIQFADMNLNTHTHSAITMHACMVGEAIQVNKQHYLHIRLSHVSSFYDTIHVLYCVVI